MGLKPIWSSKRHQSTRLSREEQPRHRKRRSFLMEALEARQMMAGPQLQAILPNEGANLLSGIPLQVSPTELVFRFDDGQTIDPTTLGAIRINRSVDGLFGNGNDQLLTPFDPGQPGFVGIGDRGNEVIVRFPSALPDDLYKITIVGTGTAPLRNIAGGVYNSDVNNVGADTTHDFRLQLAPQVAAVVPQPISRSGGILTQARDQIEVYFNANDPLNPVQAQNAAFYQLLFTNDTATPVDDQVFFPLSAVYDPSQAKVTLTFQSDLALLPTGPGTYRLRVGDSDVPANIADPQTPMQLSPADPGASYATALPIGALSHLSGSSTVVINSAIDAQFYGLDLPGGSDEPGHRDIPAESHLLQGADSFQGITTVYYNFQNNYGVDPQGNQLSNAITPTQRDRVREIFEFYGRYMGAQFAETADQGITIAVGDMRAVDPTLVNGPGGVSGVATAGDLNGLVVMDLQEAWGTSSFGGAFFTVAMHEIGHALGLGHATELPDLTVNSGVIGSFGNTGERVFPGDYDVAHLQHLYRPESKDIDLYQFQVNETGLFTAEITAERLANSSLLDSVVTLFEQFGTIRAVSGGVAGLDGALFVINDGINPAVTFEFDLFGSAPPVSGGVTIEYFAGDSAAAIAQKVAAVINATAANPAFALAARAEAVGDLVKVRGLVTVTASSVIPALEVRSDVRGILGRNDDYFSEDSFLQVRLGAGRYYVGVTSTGNTDYDPVIDDSGFGGTTQGDYQLRLHFDRDPLPAESIQDTSDTSLDGDGDGRPGGAFNYWFKVATEENTIYVDAFDRVNNPGIGNTGSLALPFKEIDQALAAVNLRNTDANPANNVAIVRIVGNGGLDGDLATVADAEPYVVGFNSGGQVLADGRSLDVPRGVTLMIDAGTVLKMRGANIDVGSVAQGIDRSEGHLQVLGLPGLPVVVTSTRDQLLGQSVESGFASGGDWGGLVFRNAEDLNVPGRRVLEREGIFLNYVNQADIRYGGGTVSINSIPATFNPIHMVQARPTITNSTIAGSANAAMSADLGSFLESRFYSNTPGSAYTTDYDRAGPEIHGNSLSLLQLGTPIGISSASNAVPISITTSTAHGLVTGQRVRISGVQGNTAANGDWTVTVTSPTSFSLNNSVGNGVAIPSTGVMQRLTVLDNTLNGLFVRIPVLNGEPIERLTVAARFDDTDIAHIITQALIIDGTPGGPLGVPGALTARTDASLTIDPGMVIKLQQGRIEAQISTQVLAEGTASNPIVFTTLNDDRFGRGGTMDTNADRANTVPTIGGWGGIFFDRLSRGSLDHTLISYAGGSSTIEGRQENFNAVEIHQADVRIANSTLRDNASGLTTSQRNDRGTNADTTIFVRGAQPVIVNNVIRDNDAQAININANSLNYQLVTDSGRSTGTVDLVTTAYANHGPLVDGNRLRNNDINAMVVRGAVLTTQSIWDDTDIVHVLFDEIEVTNHHTYSGLRLQSNPGESLVVKMQGASAGFTAGGHRLDIDDRIGGTLQVVGTPRDPVVLTAITDDSVAAGLDPDGAPMSDTNEGFRNLATGQVAPFLGNDMILPPLPPGAFVAPGNKWGSPTLGTGATITWAFMGAGVSNTDPTLGEGTWTNTPLANFMPAGFANEIRRAFAAWSAVANVTFVEVTDSGEAFGQPGAADIRVGGHLIDGAAGPVLAHAFAPFGFPTSGDLHFDTGEAWKIGFGGNPNATDIFQVATHEIGHALGIDHTNIPNSLMQPFYSEAFAGPQPDDIAAAVFLYGLPPVGTAGAWRSVRLEQFSNDRNVVVVTEQENATTSSNLNDTTNGAQFIGALATGEKHSDETLRLGFEIQGFISLVDPNDEDVYSFNAMTGTEVWFDIDRTTHSLDTVLELIDANGVILARSDDSTAELGTGVLPALPFGTNLGRLMQRDGFSGDDLYTTNPRDAGMRVVLPGATGLRNTYFIRVRSKGDTLDASEGLTRGAYQLQVRLRETDEVAGSMVRNSDIRFAINGIEVLGMPGHSPLLGDAAETTGNNDAVGSSQYIGNLLTTDRGSLSIAGNLSTATDVDFYRFELEYDLIQALGATEVRSLSAVFDIDYADGISRPDTTISVFQEVNTPTGTQIQLILTGRDSDIGEDQGAPTQGLDIDDLSRGSAGKLDPFIGSVQLPTNVVGSVINGVTRTYYVAISSNRQLPQSLNATFQANPTDPLVRLEPINSVRRVAEDHIGNSGGATVDVPAPLFSGTTSLELNLHADQFQLSDVVMFVNTTGDLRTIDALTGIAETDVTGAGNLLPTPGANQQYRDITMRSDGRIFAFAVAAGVIPSDANNGVLVELSPEDGRIIRTLATGIQTLQFDAQGAVVARDRGVTFEALDFFEPSPDARRLYAVGTIPGGTSSGRLDNVLYRLDPYTGAADPDNNTTNVPPSEPLPEGILDVGLNGSTITVTPGSNINLGDGDTFTIGTTTLEMDSGITLEAVQPGAAIADGATFSVSNGATTVLYRFDKDPSTPAPPGAVEVPINNTMSAALVAGAIAANFLSPISQVSPAPPLANPLIGVLRAVHLNTIGQPTRVYIEDLTPNTLQHSASSGTAGVTVLGQVGVTAGNTRVYFTPLDDNAPGQVSVAQRIEFALALNPIPNVTATAVPNSQIVNLVIPVGAPPLVVTIPATTPFTTAALPGGFGGIITGMQFLDNDLYAVTNSGTFLRYEIFSFGGFTPSFAVNVNQTPFSGLSLGPQNLDVDRDGVPEYARIFFATATDGRLYALDEFGAPAPIFADGATSVFVGLNAHGVAFSTLDYNLWHVTDRRGNDAGHGVNPTFDNSRDFTTNGGTSFYFGLEDPNANTTISVQPGAANYVSQNAEPAASRRNIFNTYDLPGGAQGSLTTNTFSLAGSVATDKPTLYFNYFLQTQNTNANTQRDMRDSFRVFISNDGVNWSQLATNNSILSAPAAGSSGALAELPDHLSTSGGNYRNDFPSGNLQRVQELFDNTNGWRQARVDLGDFAGLSNLRLRFDFSTAGSLNVGGLTVGRYLEALPGSQLRDGQGFTIDAQTFQFDSGFTLVAPAGAGAAILDGETFTIGDGLNPTVTFEFNSVGGSSVPAAQTISISNLDSAAEVAQKIFNALVANAAILGAITPHLNGHRVNLEGAAVLTQTAIGSPRVTVDGAPGVTTGLPVLIHEGMTDAEVARAMANAIDAAFLVAGSTDLPGFQTTALLNGARLQLPTRNITNPGPLPTSNVLQGDQFGDFFDAERGRQNAFEGAFIDDIIIGFSERGEMVTNAPNNATFFTLPTDLTQIASEQLVGDYQLEIRRGEEYGIVLDPVDAGGEIALFQVFDTNDRLAEAFSISIPAGNQIREGLSFQVSDGLNTVSFEFDSNGLVGPGAVQIPYTSTSTAVQLAQTIATLINNNALLNTLASVAPSGTRVNLVEAAFVTTAGVSLTGDLLTESNDTLGTAVASGLSTTNAGTFTASGIIGDNATLTPTLSRDVDLLSFDLSAGDRVRIDIDARQFGSALDSIVSVFSAAGVLLAQNDDSFALPAPGEVGSRDSYLEFVATVDGTYYVGVSAFANFLYDPTIEGSGAAGFTQGEYTITLSIGGDAVVVSQFDLQGDQNVFREQGQILIDGNRITRFSQAGILVDSGPRDAEGNIPRQPSVRNLREPNTARLVPGVAIQNNLITHIGQVGIQFSGDPNPANQPLSAVPFGRIVNNTIYGNTTPTGIGIQVSDNASPSILNNILANLGTGITVDASSRTAFNGLGQLIQEAPVISANLYRSAPTSLGNTGASNNGLGDLAIVLSTGEPLFESEALEVFSPARGSRAIDSSLDSLQDRPTLTTVTSPLGIGLSPILAPEFDLNGAQRVDDPSQAPPPGFGSNVFKDRGALEHIDQPLIRIDGMSVVEGNQGITNLVFTVTLDQSTNSPITVEFMTAPGTGFTAQGGLDFTNLSGTLTFLPGGATAQPITVQVIGDLLDENDEEFVVNLFNASSATILDGQAIGTIVDDDNSPTLSINDVSIQEGNSGTTPMNFTVQLSQTSGRQITVVVNTSNITATAGSDYAATNLTLTFSPGQTRQFVAVNVIGDTNSEPSETFQVTLGPASNATLLDAVGIGTIINDEPALAISSVNLAEGNAATTNFVFTVTLTPAVSGTVTVQFATAAGSAAAGADFIATNGTLTFNAGQTQQNITVAVVGETVVESDETFTVTLSGASGAGINTGTGTGTIVNDDVGTLPPPPPPPPPPPTAAFIVTGAGAGGGPHVRVLDAATGVERFGLYAYHPFFSGGVQVATGDVNGDGVDDIITGAGAGGGPHVRVFSGIDGQQLPGLIGSFYGFEPTYSGGVFVAAGDINLDGQADVFVATQTPTGSFGESASTRIRIYNGSNGGLLREFTYRSGSALAAGINLAVADINGDGRPEIIAGAGLGGGTRVNVIDPLTGGIIRDFSAYPGFNGVVYVAAGDVNGDGRADIITGAGAGGGPHVKVFDGGTNQTIRSFYAYNPFFGGGVRVGSSDVNGDGISDILTAAGFSGGPHTRAFNGLNQTEVYGFYAYNPLFGGGVFVGGSTGGSPLMAAAGPSAVRDVESLSQQALAPIVEEAIARWSGLNLGAAAVQKLRQTPVSIADLPDGMLALARADRIYVDSTGAGYGWFIDPTPGDDQEFGVDDDLRMDLLSAVVHEMGHVLGLDDLDDAEFGSEVMTESLVAGRRRMPNQSDVDAIFATEEDWRW